MFMQRNNRYAWHLCCQWQWHALPQLIMMTNSQWMLSQWRRVYRECDIPTKHGLVQYTWYSIKLTSSCPQKNCDQYMFWFWSWYVCSLTSISTLSLWLWECSYGDEYFASSVYPLIDAWLWLWHLVWTTTSLPLTIMSRLPSEWYGHEGIFAVC